MTPALRKPANAALDSFIEAVTKTLKAVERLLSLDSELFRYQKELPVMVATHKLVK